MLGLPAGWHRRAAAGSRGLPRAAHSPVLAVCRMAPPCRGRKPWAGLFPQKVAARGNLSAELVEIEIFLSWGGKSGELRERGDCQKPPLRT